MAEIKYKINIYTFIEQEEDEIYDNLEEVIQELDQLTFLQSENHYELVSITKDEYGDEIETIMNVPKRKK